MSTITSRYFRLSTVFLFGLILFVGSMAIWDTSSGKTTQKLTNGPDLTGNWERLSFTRKGRLIHGKLSVTNLGDKKSGHFKIAYYLSDDGTTPGKLISRTSFTGNLNAQKTKKFSFVYHPSTTIYGKYILAIIDCVSPVI